jgi:hypothetical protein
MQQLLDEQRIMICRLRGVDQPERRRLFFAPLELDNCWQQTL